MLSVITIKEVEKWDNIVKSFHNHDVYYLSGYTKAFQLHGDGEPILFYYYDDNIRAINVVMKRDIAKEKYFAGKLPECTYFDIATPYGYGGFLVDGKATKYSLKCLNDEYTGFCKNNGIISEFVRFHPVLENNRGMEGIYDIFGLGKTISMNLSSTEVIWSGLTSKNRNRIRKSKKSDVKIFWGRNIELYKEFIRLYDATMAKDNAKDYYYFKEGFYNSIINDLKYNALMFYALHKGKIIAMSIILFGNQQMHYHLSASDINFRHLAPTSLLLYEVACWGCENKYKTFHLGGGLGSSEDNLYKFKKAFNKNSNNNYFIGRKIFDQEKYYKLVCMRELERELDNEAGFFPKYRAEFTK